MSNLLEGQLLERRIALRLLLGAVSATLFGCVPFDSKRADSLEPKKQELVDTIESLRESYLTRLLKERVLPYFSANPPKEVARGGVDFKVQHPNISETIMPPSALVARGELRLRGSNFATSIPLYPINEVTVQVPVVGLVAPAERNRYTSARLTPTGDLKANIRFLTSNPLYEGIAPEINLWFIDPVFLTPDQRVGYPELKRSILIKEACVMLLYDIWLEEIANSMRQNKLLTHINVRNPQGYVVSAEAITQSITVLGGNRGRAVAAFDIASYLVLFQATKGTNMYRELLHDPIQPSYAFSRSSSAWFRS